MTVLATTLGDDPAVDAAHAFAGDPVVHLPGSAAYETARRAWNTAADQRPAAVAVPVTVKDVCRVVRTAGQHGLRVAAQNTGHAAAPLARRDLGDVVLMRTGALRDVHVDAARRTARIGGGARWQQVVDAAAPHGLTAAHGSAPDLGVVGYVLGGGLGWYARRHGLAANALRAAELVTAHGDVVRTDADRHPELFWALRGGGGSFGIVTAIELDLLPIADVYAGMMLWSIERAAEVLQTYAVWSPTAPPQVSASFRILRFPPTPHLPDALRGRSVVVLDAAVLLDDERAAAVMAPFRALAPELDTFARVPSATLTGLHMDPPDPTPGVGDSAVLTSLDEAAIQAFLGQVGPAAATGIFLAELRLLGGALAHRATGGGVVSHLPGSHAAMFVCLASTPDAAAAGEVMAREAVAALAPWSSGRVFLNFAERAPTVSDAFTRQAWVRLSNVKKIYDPRGLFLANHAIEAG